MIRNKNLTFFVMLIKKTNCIDERKSMTFKKTLTYQPLKKLVNFQITKLEISKNYKNLSQTLN